MIGKAVEVDAELLRKVLFQASLDNANVENEYACNVEDHEYHAAIEADIRALAAQAGLTSLCE